MKTVKRIILPLIILAVLIVWGAMKLTSNKQAIQEEATLASQTIGEIPVQVKTPEMGKINQQVVTTGTISANEELVVLSESQGKVKKVNCSVGDRVRKGDVLIEIDDEIIAANVLVAEANWEQQKKDIERMERLAEGNAIAKHDLEQARIGLKKAEADLIQTRKALRDTKIKAPISGTINKRMVEFGQFVAGGMPVCEIVNTAKLKIWTKVPEKDIFKLNKGQEVTITIPAIPGKTFAGKINSIGEKADKSMKFEAEVILNNPEGTQHLKAGLFAEVSIPVEAAETFIIEKAALVGSMKNPSVYVVEGDKAILRDIVIGDNNEKYIEVIGGLNKTELVVVTGQLNIHDGDRVKIIQ